MISVENGILAWMHRKRSAPRHVWLSGLNVFRLVTVSMEYLLKTRDMTIIYLVGVKVGHSPEYKYNSPEIQFGVPGLAAFGLFDTAAHRQQRGCPELEQYRRPEIRELRPLEPEWERETLVVQTELEVQRTQFLQR